jgi:hypothetical protein
MPEIINIGPIKLKFLQTKDDTGGGNDMGRLDRKLLPGLAAATP